ncbi:GNAT family N-acetyltransferase [Enterococcus malodoratus]|uniref:N-acetyltransferase domain-containing protein n=1 Tax=Enterococcus malodoratus ATCC 43197 TaxID=1158601 RepID=R2NXP8_9ENTE|nr:GNAT family protein [Enterococcus malodoratus]EOH75818.1 hypothetical protein UAI_02828 [Enterococcus malodoratus ATCC 43197]EOT66487.1 hypothetical protein I585_02008 [Enterococcus malodoratus ATCC 43197]SPW90491.1 acetyltransferase [Enterococcus malodoratus]STD69103.1 acetyltransferase [Enterococcus malodoratus]
MNTFTYKIDDHLSLAFPHLEAAEKLFSLLESDRPHLEAFIDVLAETRTSDDEKNFIKTKLHGYAEGTDYLFFILLDQTLCGCIDIHTIDKKVGKGEIGYWLHSSYTSRGIISKSVQAICNLAFNEFGLNKLSIFANVENLPSNRVAQKCGFSLTSIEQQDALLYGKLRDMNHYTLLKEQYEKGFDE